MKERARELKSAKRGKDQEAEVLAKIAEMPEADRKIAERLHALIKEVAPQLRSKTWYGMPAYTRGDKVVVYFQSAAKFKARYATLGFDESANLDDGPMWPTSYAITSWDAAVEKKVRALLQRAVGAAG
jgi:uncharacterized protein YdhG (YjbR/CyaY superfamily)